MRWRLIGGPGGRRRAVRACVAQMRRSWAGYASEADRREVFVLPFCISSLRGGPCRHAGRLMGQGPPDTMKRTAALYGVCGVWAVALKTHSGRKCRSINALIMVL